MPPILGLSFLCWKQGQVTSPTLLFDAIERFFFAIKVFRNASGQIFVRTSALAGRDAAAGDWPGPNGTQCSLLNLPEESCDFGGCLKPVGLPGVDVT
jgi:hypothetical protein